MELFWRYWAFLTRCIATTAILCVLLRQVFPSSFMAYQSAVLYSAGISFCLNFLYGVFLYPYYLSPLNAFPAVTVIDSSELSPITTRLRGRLALQVVTKFPGADAIYLRVFPGIETVLPVSPQAHRDILNDYAQDYCKPEGAASSLRRSLGLGLILSEGEMHTRHRKIITPSFRIQNLKLLQPLLAEKCNAMVSAMLNEMKLSGKIEITTWASRLTMDIIGPALMSRDFQSLKFHESPLETAYADLIAPSRARAILFSLSMFLPQRLIRLIPMQTNRRIDHDCATIRQVCMSILKEKLRNATNVPEKQEAETSDILGSIIASKELTEPEIVDQMMTFLGAGHETTAASIAWAAHLLTLPEYYHYQAQLREEVRGAMHEADGDILSFTVLERLPVLNAVCEEVLRLYPPVTNTGRRAIRDTTIAGNLVKKNTFIVLCPWAINRNPYFWVDAEKMLPERWIDITPDGTKRLNHHGGVQSNMCVQTFLHGQRSCIGRDFARAELRYALASIFANHELLRLPEDDLHVVPAGSLTIKPRGGLYLRIQAVA